MTNDQIMKMIEDAKRATAGKWNECRELGYKCVMSEDGYQIVSDNHVTTARNKRHIANTCPDNIIPLLEELLQYRSCDKHDPLLKDVMEKFRSKRV